MQVTASFGGEEVAVEVDADCRTLAAFKATLQAALPSLDVEKMCLEVGGRALDDERVLALEGGSVVELSPTPAARAADTLREEGCDLDGEGFRRAVSGDVRVCGLYLDAGVLWGDADTPLHLACDNGYVGICKLLLDRGCEKEARDEDDMTPLLVGAFKGHTETCKLLLDRGCEKEARNKARETPLFLAADGGHVEMCKLLLERGCEAHLKNIFGVTPLSRTSAQGHTEVHTLLVDHIRRTR